MTTPEHRRTQRLADVLTRLMGRANLGPSVLARRAGISPATMTHLLRGHVGQGKPSFPTPDMLKHIALGLATNGLGERDLALADRHYVKMMRAIGYLDAPSLVYQPPLPQEVLDILTDNPDLAIELGQLGPLTSEDAKLLRQAIASHRARFVRHNDGEGVGG